MKDAEFVADDGSSCLFSAGCRFIYFRTQSKEDFMTNKIARRLASIGLAVSLAGCATGSSFQEIAHTIPSLRQGQGRIYFVRTDDIPGFALQPGIQLNGDVVGHSQPNGFFFVDRPPGEYTVATSTEVTKFVTFHLNAGKRNTSRRRFHREFLLVTSSLH